MISIDDFTPRGHTDLESLSSILRIAQFLAYFKCKDHAEKYIMPNMIKVNMFFFVALEIIFLKISGLLVTVLCYVLNVLERHLMILRIEKWWCKAG